MNSIRILKIPIVAVAVGVVFFTASSQSIQKDEFRNVYMTQGMRLDSVCASNEDYWDWYRQYLTFLDIHFESPSGFHVSDSIHQDLGNLFLFYPNKDYHSRYFRTPTVGGSACNPPYLSDDGNAMILIPVMGEGSPIIPDHQMEAELIAAYSDDHLDCTTLIYSFSGEDAKYTNADRVYLYEFNLPQPINDQFSHCIGIAFRKKDHYSFQIKLLLTEVGLKYKDEYIKDAIRSIRYGDKVIPECVELEKKVEYEGIYPKKKYTSTGIIVECEPYIQ